MTFKSLKEFKKYRQVLLLSVLFAGAWGYAGDRSQELGEKQELGIITKLASALIANSHYRQHMLDNKISSKIFDAYFNTLDPGKIYFSREDIKKFEKYRYYLDDLTQMGNSDFAFEVYDFYLKRLEEYREFAEKQLKKGFDFSKDEYILADRSKVKRCAAAAELKELWRKRLKSDVLYFRLLKRSMQMDRDNALKNAGKDEKKDTKAVEIMEKMWSKQTPEQKILRRLRDIYNEMSQKSKLSILSFFLTCVAQTYGPHSSYFSPELEEDFDISMKLSLVGIGAVLTSDNGYTKIVSIIPGGPAAKDGSLKADDRIIAVTQEEGDPVDIVDMSVTNVVKLIRGKKGTKVTLTVLPGAAGHNTVPKNVTITRDEVKLKNAEASGSVRKVKAPDGQALKIGIINLSRFYLDFDAAIRGDKDFKSSSRDVAEILRKFEKEGVDGVVIDLRSNGGGSLREAINLTGLFIEDGPVVQVRNSRRRVSVKYDPDETIHYKGPLVVMTNKLSSSAAEIFTGAIKDYHRGIIVGDSRTYGKGTVLNVIKLDRLLQDYNKFKAGSVKFESEVFYRINGSSTQQLGVKPDIQLPSFTEYMEIGEEFNENHLPWDSINQVEHRDYDQDMQLLLKDIEKRSLARRDKDPRYKILLQNIEKFNAYRKRREISLNEKKRWAEYLSEKKILEVNEKYIRQISGDDEQEDDKTGKSDLLLDEAVDIMADYIELKKETPKVALDKSRPEVKLTDGSGKNCVKK
ncbi:MAG: carboxy terminal-processing peptidase [Victivallales bacterium]|nr:carboxy terminal-processing peptidase [Victivallales bacterium]